MKRFIVLFTLLLLNSDILLAAKVLKVKNGKFLVKLTRAEQSQLVKGDQVTVMNEKDEIIEGTVVLIKEGRKAVIVSDDFVEYSVGDFVDVDYTGEDEEDELEEEMETN